jgi:hypothetical protein
MVSYYLDQITSAVQGRFDSAQEFAEAAWNYAAAYLANLTALIQNFTPSWIDLDFDIPPINISAHTPNRPTELSGLLKEKLTEDLEAGGTGLDEDVEQAIYDRAQARQDLINERVHQEALELWASRGWTIPPGALAGRLEEATIEQTRADAELNKDVMIMQAQLALDNQHFILTSALTYFGNEVQLYDADIRLASVQIEAEIKSYEVQMQHEINIINLLLKQAEINLNVLLENYKIQTEAIRAGAQIYAQLAASALSSVSAGAQMSYRGGYDYSYNDSTSRSYSESHTHYYNR